MTEPHDEAVSAEQPQKQQSASASADGRAAPGWRALVIALSGALLLLVALVVTAPLWSPALPWTAKPTSTDSGVAARLGELAAAQRQVQQTARQEGAVTKAAVERLEKRIGAIEARPPPAPVDLTGLRSDSTKLSIAVAELANRVAALEKMLHAQAASETSETGLALVLLQVHDAVAAGRPFTAEYDALATLARGRPDIAAAAGPLAEPARTGVVSRAVLGTQLRALRAAVAAKPTASAPTDWGNAALARLRGLVTIRRVDGAGEASGSEAAMHAAQQAFADGDLAGAVAALGTLAGPSAEAARPWLRLAKQRLAVEAALSRIAALLSAKIGGAAAVPSAPR